METSLLQRQNTYTITKVMSETQKSSSQVKEMQESQSIATKIEENSELSQSTGTGNPPLSPTFSLYRPHESMLSRGQKECDFSVKKSHTKDQIDSYVST